LNTASKIAHIPVWTFHGAKDRLVKPSRSREMVDALKKLNGKIRYTEYPEIGHDSWKAAYAEPDFLKWLFDQILE
jgi:predicted peptidase